MKLINIAHNKSIARPGRSGSRKGNGMGRKAKAAVAMVLWVFFTDCNGGSAYEGSVASTRALNNTEGIARFNPESSKESAASEGEAVHAPPKDRKLIYTAYMTITALSPHNTVKTLGKELERFAAYVASQDTNEETIELEIKVPAENFEGLLGYLETMGKVRRKSIQARDVTESYYDLENRVKNKRILVERYQTYLKNAKNIEELLAAERFLNEATTELERLEGGFRKLVNEVQYATVSITIEPEVYSARGKPGLGERLKQVIFSFSYTLQTLVVGVVVTVLYGVPLVMVLAVFWLLLFGRVGWLRKLFRLVSAEKSAGEK